jgi:hypothetical protein
MESGSNPDPKRCLKNVEYKGCHAKKEINMPVLSKRTIEKCKEDLHPRFTAKVIKKLAADMKKAEC